MCFEQEVEKHLKDRRYSLVKDIYFFLLLSLCILLIFYSLRYFNTGLENLGIIYLISFSVFSILFVIFFLLSKYSIFFSSLLVFLFIFSTFYISLTFKFFSPFPLILILISFFLLLILFSNEKLPFLLIGFFTIFKIVITLMEVEFGFERVVLFEKGDVFGCLISYWFLLLFLYILIKGCLLMKLCQREILLVARNYRNIANLEYRNRLLGRVSKCILHDITTPISVISGYLKLSNDNDEQFKLKKSALGSLLYLEMLLNGSMNIVKKQSEHNYFATDISLLEMLEILRRRIEKSNIKLNLYLSGDCNIKGDKCLFCRIFLNLLVNAIEELEVSRKKERIIDIKSSVEDGYYVMNIKDNGRGLSKEFLEKLDSKNIDLGYEDDMGIGLFFVCITMRREFKGDIKYRSVKWKYTNVELKFPL